MASLPKDLRFEAVHPFGRTPITATLKNKSWATSLWTDKEGDSMIPLPKKIRGALSEGDEVCLSFIFDQERFSP